MATLSGPEGQSVELFAHHRVGRAPSADLVVAEPQVSGEHALFRWNGVNWEVRDLGSRNGTWVNGVRVASGQSAALVVGTSVSFGGLLGAWVLTDDAPPRMLAVPVDGGVVVAGEGQMLALPDAEHPVASIYSVGTHWVLDRDGVVAAVSDGEVVTVGTQSWRLHIPTGVTGTAESPDFVPEEAIESLSFEVSLDEEHIEVQARLGTRTVDLGARSHHYLLLTLARARLADRGEGSPPSEEGWLYTDQVQKMLCTTFSTLQVHVFRARRQLGEAHILNPAGIIERRADSGQMRLGVANIVLANG